MNHLLDEVAVLEVRGDPAAVDVHGVAHDSRSVHPGDLFCCLPGHLADGHAFAPAAVRNGAVALVCEQFVDGLDDAVVQARVAPGQARPSMARLAAALYGHPARHLLMAGVTGTNGKTTVAHLLGSVLEAAGHPTAVLGTISGARTTPEADELQARLAEVLAHQQLDGLAHAVAMEVSSHALAQHRVDAVRFDVAAFTNLSHDHLDFHGTMEAYFEAKASLFTPEHAVRGVVFADDPWGARLVAEAVVPVVAVHRSQALDLELEVGRTAFTWRGLRVTTRLTGAVNVDNALVAAEAAVALGLDPNVVVAGLAAAVPVPGRLEPVSGPDGSEVSVLVDYAHTPAALEAVLAEGRRLLGGTGRLVVVFGCGGERDQAKRPVMGAVASAGADVAVVTTDNPRSEGPLAIIDQILDGVPPGALADRVVLVEPERHRAIDRAVALAEPGDLVLVAGKGHETYQEADGVRRAFDDRLEASAALERHHRAPGA